MAGWSAGSVHELLRSRCSAAFSNYFSARSAARRLRRTYCDLATRRRPRGVRALRFCSCRLSASTVLKLFQPAAGCCTLETVLAMAQPVRVHNGTSSRCAAALGLRSGPVLQVCRALRRLPPAVHRSHFSDCASCARMSGSCSASRSTTRPIIGDHRHTRRRSGRACSAWRAHAACRGTAAAMRHGWSRAHDVEPRPGSCGDHPHTPVACMGARLRVRCLAKFPSLRCRSAVLSARPVFVVFQDSNAVGCRNLSVVSSR